MTKTNVIAAAQAKVIKRNLLSLADPGDVKIEKTEPEAEDKSEDSSPVGNRKLTVLKDPDAHKLVMRLYTQFVSDNDFSDLIGFIQDFDTLLAKYRKGKPMTQMEIEKVEEQQQGGAGGNEEEEEGEEGEDEDGVDPEEDIETDKDGDEEDEDDNSDEENEDADEAESDTDEGDEADEPSITVSEVQAVSSTLASLMASKRVSKTEATSPRDYNQTVFFRKVDLLLKKEKVTPTDEQTNKVCRKVFLAGGTPQQAVDELLKARK